MANVLFLVHRLPFPPNKGDKVRSYHLLKHLVAHHRVFLGTFVDDPADEVHVDTLRAMCAGLHVARLAPARSRLASLAGLVDGQPLTLHYYRDHGLQGWVDRVVADEHPDVAVVFSSSMAPYAERHPGLPMLVDFVDVDSAKWSEYAHRHAWPLSWLYRREGERLLAYERSVASQARRSFFVTEKECALFRSLAPECGGLVEPLANGVDADYFAPDADRASPYPADAQPIVFTGAMDYWPNVDAVSWFATEMLPALRERHPNATFHIVGRSPTAAVKALEGSAVQVTGTVPDVRPYLQHAACVVAPLRLARGIQNKILEAMAMARPVVASAQAASALEAEPGSDLLAASDVGGYVQHLESLLSDPALCMRLGSSARRRVVEGYSWPAQLAAMDRHLRSAMVPRNPTERPVPASTAA